jgi:hypothetical protein
MNDIDIPIVKKSYELYRTIHDYRKIVPKSERFTLYERIEDTTLDTLEYLFEAGYSKSSQKATVLERASVKLNLLRLLVRLMKDTRTFDTKKYATIEGMVDEIGRMLGGWIRSTTTAR